MTRGADPKKLYQQVARDIANSIAEGRYRLGERLPSERHLAEAFGVSRPTVRDAMIALEFQGLVEARAGSGIYVTEPAPESPAEPDITALQLVEARRIFEGEACALAAAAATPEALTQLEGLAQAMAQAADAEAVERLEAEFQLALAGATRNAAVVSAIDDLRAMSQTASCQAGLRAARREPAAAYAADHLRIVEALRARDGRAARQAMHDHLAGLVDALLALSEAEALEQARAEAAARRLELLRRTSL